MITLEGNYCQIKLCIFSICLTSLPGAKPLLCFRTHAWFVNTMQRSPFFKDILLTTGGWNFAIWKEGVMVLQQKTLITSHDVCIHHIELRQFKLRNFLVAVLII